MYILHNCIVLDQQVHELALDLRRFLLEDQIQFIHVALIIIIKYQLNILSSLISLMKKQMHPSETLKVISNCQTHQQFLQIPEPEIYQCIKQYFQECHLDDQSSLNIKDISFYLAFKKLAESYFHFLTFIAPTNRNSGTNSVGAQLLQKGEDADLQGRKNTRATFAMRHSKNQEELKKDQIFVRLIPRTHNCIHFMVKNHNFPRMECRLSCNQHLEYLVNHLTNKWLRGKVGVGYQIKLFPDPSTYMHKHSNQGKRPIVIHEPLNNYLMFTDIMAAFGVGQNGCINLLYDVTQLRKQKEKHKNLSDKQILLFNNQSKIKPNSALKEEAPQIGMRKQILGSSHKKQIIKTPQKFGHELKQLKFQSGMKHQINHHQQQLSIGIVHNRKNNNNSIDYSQVNSIGYQFGTFNSNNILNTLFNVNNSNTFLNAINGMQVQKINAEQHPSSPLSQNKDSNKGSKTIKNTLAIPVASPQNKLESIRNYISIVQKQAGGIHEPSPQVTEKQENSLHKSQSNFKKQVKTVTIIKKKNQTD